MIQKTTYIRDAGPNPQGIMNTASDLIKGELVDDWLEPILGSYEVSIKPLNENNPYEVEITVLNITGLESGTRFSKYGGNLWGPYVQDSYAFQIHAGYPMKEIFMWRENIRDRYWDNVLGRK